MDRNQRIAKPFREQFKSLSARRAWIEMFDFPIVPVELTVALRKESVDRNIWVNKTQSPPSMSLSARRAWIEMSDCQL